MRKLGQRLILSHILPLLITIPLMGASLVYLLETRVILPSISRELEGDAIILTEILQERPEWWSNSTVAQELLLSTYPRLTKRVMLISPEGRLLASTDPADNNRLNQTLTLSLLQDPPVNDLRVTTNYSQGLQAEIVDVLAPASSESGKLLGFVRVSSKYTTITQELLQLRYVIGFVTILGLALGGLLGSTLAINIGKPLQQVTQAVIHLTKREKKERIAEEGPEEIRSLILAVNELVERLRSLEQSRQQLLSNLIHELGRPLGSLRMAVQVLLHGSKDDPAQLDELLQGMDLEMGNLQRLVEDLAHLHDQVLGPLELNMEIISLDEWLPAVLRPWEELAHQQQIDWRMSFPPVMPAIKADPMRLSQIIGNLVSNALKYTPSGGTVQLSAGMDGQMFWLEVSDTGPGIDMNEQEQIFKPFYRARHESLSYEGMGLGLAIVADLVHAHRGRVELKSEPGKGSQFRIFLPTSSTKDE
ncbi:MAG TPA: ATP-binding protein [Anaerolineales bacterium]|nr:ATP-binding protein [Anaerolineales bacterium]